MGAPRKHPPKNAVEEIERLAAQGYSIIGLGKHFGVARPTIKRWLEEDEELQEAYESGRDAQRQQLETLLMQSAIAGKNANANAMFVLKCKFGWREMDSPNTKVDVAVAVQSVLVVKDFGTDEQWAARTAEQQRKLMQVCSPEQSNAPQSLPDTLEGVSLWNEAAAPAVVPPVPFYDVPTWKGRA